MATAYLAIYLHRQGWNNGRIASHLSVNKNSIKRWLAIAHQIEQEVKEQLFEAIVEKWL